MTRVLVIGAGIGGLSAAIELAARGYSVTVLEADDRVGGKAGREMIDGLEIDTGPSVLTLPEVFDDLFRLANTTLSEHVELIRPEPAFRYLFPDGVSIQVHHALEATLDELANTLGPGARDELSAFLDYAAQIWRAASPNFVFAERPTLATIARLGLKRHQDVTAIDPLRTMWRAIRERVRDPHLRSILARYATYNGSDVRHAPATLNCIAHVELARGGFGVSGGLFRLVEAMAAIAQGLGVEIRLGTRVTKLRFDGGRISGLELEDEVVLSADAVVCNADVGHLLAALLPSGLDHGLRPPSPLSMSGLTAVWAAAPLTEPRAAHTVIFPEDYESEFSDIFDHGRAPSNPTLYLCAQDRAHGRRAWPDGRAPLFVMTNAPAVVEQGAKVDDTHSRLESISHRLQSLGLLGARDECVWWRSPLELARRYPGSGGALYGAASNGKFAAFLRPSNRVEGVPGLYLASGSAHPGGGLPLCATSGRLAARAIISSSET